MNKRRMALVCVLLVAVVVVVFWVILESPVVARMSVDASSGRRVTCAVHAEKGGYSIRTRQHGSLWSHGGYTILRFDSDAPPEDIAIDYDDAAEDFVIAIGKQKVRVDVHSRRALQP